ncbi:MAG: saccharopine dehydrogenase, partial [Planctomycetota bacterium]
MNFTAPHIWLRSETKPDEKRTPLTPSGAQELIGRGFRLTVEKSTQSIFRWELYEEVGCEIVEEFSWQIAAPD